MTKAPYDFVTATFFFFKAVGRRPGGALAIAISQIVGYVLIAALMIAAFMPIFSMFIEMEAEGREPSAQQALTAVGSVGLLGMLGVLLAIMFALSVQGAWLRLLTRDEVKGGIPLRFGADELRLFGVNIIFIAFWVIASIAGGIVIAIAGAGGAGLLAAGEGSVWAGLGAGVVWFLGFVALAVAAIWICIKFAAAPAMTVNEQRFRLFESFAATKGIVGWMFLSYLVLVAIILVGATIISVFQPVVVVAGLLGSFGTLQGLEHADPETAQEVFEILRQIFTEPGILAAVILVVLIQIAFQILYEGLWHGVGAYAAVRHSGGEAAKAEDISAPAGSVGAAPGEG